MRTIENHSKRVDATIQARETREATEQRAEMADSLGAFRQIVQERNLSADEVASLERLLDKKIATADRGETFEKQVQNL